VTAAYPQCSILRRNGERCTAEALTDDPDEVFICADHAARVTMFVLNGAAQAGVELAQDKGAAA
jgi:hypothetical protein